MTTNTSVVPDRRRGRLGIIGRLKTGLILSRDSFAVLREHPKLLIFPLLGGIVTLVFWALLLVPVVAGGLIGGGIEYAVVFLLYFVTTFIGTFFTAALIFAVNQAFHGEDPHVGECIRAAWRRKWPILVWSVVASTVSLLLRRLRESNNALGRIVSSLFGIGWTIMTFFVVPVIVFEEVSLTSMFKRSGETFRETWGESIGVGFGVTLLQIVIAIGGLIIALGLALLVGMVVPPLGLVLGIALAIGVLVGTFLVGQTIWAITKTALYVFAAEAHVPDQFDDFDFETLGGRTSKGATPGRIRRPRLHLDEW